MAQEYVDAHGIRYKLLTVGISDELDEKQAVYEVVGKNEVKIESINKFNSRFRNVNNSTKSQLSTHEKIKLYKSRFKARTDIYAKRYFNKKLQKFIYSPVTTFTNGMPDRNNHLPLTNEVIKEHLKGEKFIGLYPLLLDNKTNFLVIDIDKKNWKTIVTSICSVSKKYGLKPSVEKSQSGNGGHIWYFFEVPIKAKLARNLGKELLKATMAVNPDISFEAFDRLFPNQDELPDGGFGNLIAAPLQFERMKQGNSVFIDSEFNPFENQWDFLEQVETLSEQDVVNAINNLLNEYKFQLYSSKKEDNELIKDETYNFKNEITVIRSNQLYFPIDELTNKQIMVLRWGASFYNPEYFLKQKQRFSTWDTPQYISLAHKYEHYIGLPRGLETNLVDKISNIKILDRTVKGQTIGAKFIGSLRENQKHALVSLMQNNMGVLAARTGFGKTVISASLIAQRNCSTLIIVNNKNLGDQWFKRLNEFLQVSGEPLKEYTPTGRKKKKHKIGTIYGGKKSVSNLIDIATVQTLSKMKNIDDFLDNYGMVIIDEVHHVAAVTFDQVVMHSKAKYIYGLSATPYRRDKYDPIIFMRAGSIAFKTEKVDEKQILNVSRKLIPRITKIGELNTSQINNQSISENYEMIIHSDDRNKMIVQDIVDNNNCGRHQLVLTQRIMHIKILSKLIPKTIKVFELSGSQKPKENKRVIDEITKYTDPYVILATGSFVGEGFDLATIDTLLLVMPISWKGNTEQYVGRMSRNVDTKNELLLFDYVDLLVPMFARMYQKRLRTYRDLHYSIVDNGTNSMSRIFDNNSGLTQINDDFKNINRKIVISFYKLNVKLIELIESIRDKNIELIVSNQTDISRLKLDKDRYTLRFIENVTNIVIIDDKIVWYGFDQILNHNNNGLAMRFENSELADELKKTIGVDLF